MKKILFLSKSHLAHNLLHLVVQNIPKKVSLFCYATLQNFFLDFTGKNISLVILDENIFDNNEKIKNEFIEKIRDYPTENIRFIGLKAQKSTVSFTLPLSHFESYRKPFMAEEFCEILLKNLGYKI